MARWIFGVGGLAYLLILGLPAQAQEPVSPFGLYRQGEALVRRGQFEAALKKFSAAHRLSPHPATQFAMAECHAALGQDDLAMGLYFKVATTGGADPALKRRARQAMDRLLGAAVAPAMREAEALAGQHAAEVSTVRRTSWQPWLGLGLTTVGVGLLAMSGVAAAHWANQEMAPTAFDEQADVLYPHSDLQRQKDHYSRAYNTQMGLAIGGLVGGGVAVGVGLYLIFKKRSHETQMGAASGLRVAPAPGGASLSYSGRFN
jgi:hypothetical protein